MATDLDYELPDVKIPMWIKALAGLDPEVVDAAFYKLMRTWKPFGRKFPALPDLLSLITDTAIIAVEQLAENAWSAAILAIDLHYHPDIGWKGPPIEDRIKRAIAAAGGTHFLSQCSTEELVWAKKRFLENYIRAETINADMGLIDSSVRKLLEPVAERKSIAAAPPQRAIALPAADTQPRPLMRVERPVTVIVERTEEELAAFKVEEKRKMDNFLAAHPEISR